MNIGYQFSQKIPSNYQWMSSSIKQNKFSPNFNSSDSINSSGSSKISFSISSSQTSLPNNNFFEQDNKMFLKQKPYFFVQNISTPNFLKKEKQKYLSESYHFQASSKQQTLENRVHELQQTIKKHQQILSKFNILKDSEAYQNNYVLGDITNKQINNKIITKGHQKIDKQNQELNKQIEKLKKQIRKMAQREQVQNQFKKLQSSIKQIMSSFKKCFVDEIESLNKKQDKLKKRISSQKVQKTNQSLQQSINNLKKQFSIDLQYKISKLLCQKIVPSSQKFMGISVLLKIKQEIFYAKKQTVIKNPQPNSENYSSLQFRDSQKSNNESLPALTQSENVQNFNKIENGVCQMTYYIDSQGYLLDTQSYYLLFEGKKIKLSEEQLNILQINKILQ